MNRSGFVSGALFFNASATFTCGVTALTITEWLHRRVESSGKSLWAKAWPSVFFWILVADLTKNVHFKITSRPVGLCAVQTGTSQWACLDSFGWIATCRIFPFLWKKHDKRTWRKTEKLFGKMSMTSHLGSVVDLGRKVAALWAGLTDSHQHFHISQDLAISCFFAENFSLLTCHLSLLCSGKVPNTSTHIIHHTNTLRLTRKAAHHGVSVTSTPPACHCVRAAGMAAFIPRKLRG